MRKVFHYSQNRALTVRELAALQTFPDSLFLKEVLFHNRYSKNAVPPELARHITEAKKNA